MPYTASHTPATSNLSPTTPPHHPSTTSTSLSSTHSPSNLYSPTTSTSILSTHSTTQQGYSIPHQESNVEDSLLRTARPVTSQQALHSTFPVSHRIFIGQNPRHQNSFTNQSPSGSLKSPSSEQGPSIHPRPVSEQGPSIHPRPVSETSVKPSAPPLNAISPLGGAAAKGTMAANKFPGNYKQLNKSPGDEPAVPSSSTNYTSVNSLESFERISSHHFQTAVSRQHTDSDVELVPGNVTMSSPANHFKVPQAPVRSHVIMKEASPHELIRSSVTMSTTSSTSSEYTGAKSDEFCVTPKEQQMAISASARMEPAFENVLRNNPSQEENPVIEQNSYTRAKAVQKSSGSTVPVSEVYALLHGDDKLSPPKRRSQALSHQKVADLAGAETFSSQNDPVDSLGSENSSSDNESPTSDEAPASSQDPHPQVFVSPVAEESPRRGKRAREGEQEELAMPGTKRLRSGMATRSSAKNKQNSSSLLRWIGSKIGLVKQETDAEPND